MQICLAYQLSDLSVLICIKLIKLYKNEIIQKIWAMQESSLTAVRLKRDPPVYVKCLGCNGVEWIYGQLGVCLKCT